MKVIGRTQILEEPNTTLLVEEPLSAALCLPDNAQLYAVALTGEGKRPPRYTQEAHAPWVTIIATPFPNDIWPRLIRISVTVDPAPGSLQNVLRSLNSCGLLCRAFESTNGLNLRNSMPFDSTMNDREPDAAGQGNGEKRLIIPSTILVLEIAKSSQETSENGREMTLHGKLLDYAAGVEHTNLRKDLEQRLCELVRPGSNGTAPGPTLYVDWISRMATLNNLASGARGNALPSARRKFVARGRREGGNLTIDMRPWRKLLWSPEEKVPDIRRTQPPQEVVALTHVDSDEKILVIDLFSSKRHLILDFDLLLPAYGRENEWWEWVCRTIYEEADGNILTASTTSRVDGAWSTLRVTVVFPYEEQSDDAAKTGDVVRILNCIKTLQGDRWFTDLFVDHCRTILGEDPWPGSAAPRRVKHRKEVWKRLSRECLRSQLRKMTERQEPVASLYATTLFDVHLLDPHFEQSHDRALVRRFGPNRFSFTRPLDLKTYRRLYRVPKSTEHRQKTLRLAESIADDLSQEEGRNVAIVGAPRSGKTSVLNLVSDMLAARVGDHGRDCVTLPVRVNASTTSPLGLFIEVEKEIRRLSGKKDLKGLQEVLKRISDGLAKQAKKLSNIGALAVSLQVPGGGGSISVERDQGATFQSTMESSSPDETLKAMMWRLGDATPLQSVELIKTSLDSLGEALNPETFPGSSEGAVADSEGSLENAPEVRIAVIMDEVSTLSTWGQAHVFPIWRHVVEAKEYRNLRWLISTSRPLDESVGHSPFTNVFVEYNLGSLEKEECTLLLDSFSESTEVFEEPTDGNGEPIQVKSLAPLLTHHARVYIAELTSRLPYLLQVVCYYLYDRGTTVRFPVLSRRVCRTMVLEVILPELSDYLEHQWLQLPKDVQKDVLEALLPMTPVELLQSYSTTFRIQNPLPARALKALARSGLRGDDSQYILAPLVAAWLLEKRPGDGTDV